MGKTNIWRDRLWIWLIPCGLMLTGGAATGLYQTSFSGRAHLGGALLESRTKELKQLRRHRENLTEAVTKIENNRREIEEFYRYRLETERTRLTAVIAEVKDLARRAGLEPRAISYPSEQVEEFDLSTRFMVFGVDGRYAQLRRLINFLELSDMFLVINEIGLSDHGADEKLRINLRVSTTFRGEPQRVAQSGRLQVEG